MVNETFSQVLALVAGILLGVLFFGGLWFTVQKLVSSKLSGLWLLASLLIRTGLVVTGFFFISGGRWQRLLLCLLGFVMARFIVLAFTRPRLKQGASHAP